MRYPEKSRVDILFLILILAIAIGMFSFSGFVELVGKAYTAPVGESFVNRTYFPFDVRESTSLLVTLRVRPAAGEHFVFVDEKIPPGFLVTDPGSANTSDPGHLKWLILDPVSTLSTQDLDYVLFSPSQNGTYGFYGNYTFSQSSDVFDIGGSEFVYVNNTPTTCVGQEYLMDYDNDVDVDTLDNTTFNGYYSSLNLLADVDGNGFVNSSDQACMNNYVKGVYAFPPSTSSCEVECAGCRILDLDVASLCSQSGCIAGESVRISATLGNGCSAGVLNLYFRSADGECSLEQNGVLPTLNVSCAAGLCDLFWDIDIVPNSCAFKNVSLVNATYKVGSSIVSRYFGTQNISFGNSSPAVVRLLPSQIDENTETQVFLTVRPDVLSVNESVPSGFEISDLGGGVRAGQEIVWSGASNIVYSVRSPSVSSSTSFVFDGRSLSSSGLNTTAGSTSITVVDVPPTGGSGGGGSGGGGGGGGGGGTFTNLSSVRSREFVFSRPVEKVVARYEGFTTLQVTLSQQAMVDTELEEYYTFKLSGNAAMNDADVIFIVDDDWLTDHPDAAVSLYFMRGATPVRLKTRESGVSDNFHRYTASITGYGTYLIGALVPPPKEQPAEILIPETDEIVREIVPISEPSNPSRKGFVFIMFSGSLVALLVVAVLLWRSHALSSSKGERLSLLRESYSSAFEYTRMARLKGVSDDLIRAKFLGAGWSPEDVDLVISNT